MNRNSQKRPARARSGLRPAPAGSRAPNPRVPGDERSKAHDKARDGRTAHDKDGNTEAQRELSGGRNPTRP